MVQWGSSAQAARAAIHRFRHAVRRYSRAVTPSNLVVRYALATQSVDLEFDLADAGNEFIYRFFLRALRAALRCLLFASAAAGSIFSDASTRRSYVSCS